ncbi:MSEP-CTERM sorting domain-containing protein [Hymenobacter sp. UYCo722]|uniref:MSEP-CTERM sorting domain-containing protein n=1 Tax=Hymenobacter sp. UYCo722 TaxID=3156335 RepID=UPI00339970B1
MQSLRTPKWIFLASTAPLLVYLLICAGEFSVIKTLLPTASVGEWRAFGAVLGLLGLGGAGYAGGQLARRQPVGGWYSVVALLAFSLWLCLLTWHADELLPRSVPAWMVPTNPILMAWTFLMPTLAHAMLALVAKFTPDDQPQQAAPNILLAVVVPMGWGLVFEVLKWVELLLGSMSPDVYTGPTHWETAGTVILAVALVLGTLSFFFFLTRALFIVSRRRERSWADGGLVWKVVVTIGLPLLGLGVNNGLFFGQGFREANGIFGNFSSPWFYGLAILNGVLLCLPDSGRPGLRLAQLLGRSALFGFTFYFFLVFLPFLPLAIPAIILIGVGFLLLAPLLLFVVHVRQLSDDVAALRTVYPARLVATALVAGLAVLPLYFTGSFWHRRRVLHEALAYVYTPDYTQLPHVDAPALAATLAQVRQNKDRNQELFFGSQQPYLSTFFNWLVLDNLMLSEHKINELELVFVGTVPDPDYLARNRFNPASGTAHRFSGADLDGASDPAPDPEAPQLRRAAVRSTYDARQQAWVSWVDLEVVNRNPSYQNREYSTAIRLPEGCWVGDYTLTIGNRQEHGILAEKKAATWVFAQILSENSSRDPGLLAYRGPNEIAVRVYPVSGGEARRTSIQFLHKEPCTLTVDGRPLALGDSAAAPLTAPISVPGSGVAYLSGAAKLRLPLVQRRPYYQFLLDASAGQPAPVKAFRARLARQLAQSLPNGAPARFSLVNAATTPVPAGTSWAEALGTASGTGGFYLGGAIRRVLFAAQEHPSATYPVLVAVTDDFNNAVLDADFEDFRSAYPESDVFYVLGSDGRLVPHSLRHAPRQPLSPAAAAALPAPGAPARVRAWPDAAHPRAYLAATAEAAVVVTGRPTVHTADAPAASRWLAGLRLRGYGQWQSFHPEITDRERVPFIQASFRAGILTPFTSFLALENDAQKAALHRKQEQTLAANASLDTVESENSAPTATPIDSGALLLLAAGLLLAGWHLRRSRGAARVLHS